MNFNAFEKPLEATALKSIDGSLVVVMVAQTRPPGARVAFSFAGVTLHGKVIRMERLSPDCLEMSIRVNNVSRADRETLEQSLNA